MFRATSLVMRASRRSLATEASAAATGDRIALTLAAPYEAFHKGKPVGLVTLPGVLGEFGLTAGHTPIISELKSGVVQVFENVGDSEPLEKWFVSGGFVVADEANTAKIMAVECVKLDQLDVEKVKSGLQAAKSAMDSAVPDSVERAQAQIKFETHEAMISALGLSA